MRTTRIREKKVAYEHACPLPDDESEQLLIICPGAYLNYCTR
jgi:hypothetical protein